MNYLDEITKENFDAKMDKIQIPQKRKDLLFNIITNKLTVPHTAYVPIIHYSLKTLFPEVYNSNKMILPEDLYNNCELYEYDSAKNGQNIIKHGFGFGTLMSYFDAYGVLNIPLKNINNEERIVIFSRIDCGKNGENLPIPDEEITGKIATMTIAKQIGFKQRFISSMRLSSKESKWKRQIATAIKIENYSGEQKKYFLNRCHEILNERLFIDIN